MSGFALDAARLAGLEEVHPAPLRLEQLEVVVNGCEGAERLLVSIMEPLYGVGEPLNILVYRVGLREALNLARSMTVAYSLADGLGCTPRKPRLVVLDKEPPRCSEPLLAELLGRGSSWVGVYRLTRLGLALGDRMTVEYPEGLLLDCSGCDRDLCRMMASFLDAAGVLQGVRLDSGCVSPREFVDSGVASEAPCRGGGRTTRCMLVDDEYLMLEGCRVFYTLVFRLLGVDDSCLRDLARFEAKTGLDECRAGFVIGFKRMADLILNRRLW